jgi:hypothetical protein
MFTRLTVGCALIAVGILAAFLLAISDGRVAPTSGLSPIWVAITRDFDPDRDHCLYH